MNLPKKKYSAKTVCFSETIKPQQTVNTHLIFLYSPKNLDIFTQSSWYPCCQSARIKESLKEKELPRTLKTCQRDKNRRKQEKHLDTHTGDTECA